MYLCFQQELLNLIDTKNRLVILDKGNGWQRHQLIRKKYPMDFNFKLNEEFIMYHPVLNENVKVIAHFLNIIH